MFYVVLITPDQSTEEKSVLHVHRSFTFLSEIFIEQRKL